MINNEKLVFRLVTTISIIVFVLVVILNKKILGQPSSIPDYITYLPKLNALINATCSIILLVSLYKIKQGKIEVHKKLNLTAFFLSCIFLISYVIFHYFLPETHFQGTGTIKLIYYMILISHIILAAVVLPLILLSFFYGLKNEKLKHKKIVRFSYPIWLYVTITGVIVYFMISPYYQF